jgi:hypothetical protein
MKSIYAICVITFAAVMLIVSPVTAQDSTNVASEITTNIPPTTGNVASDNLITYIISHGKVFSGLGIKNGKIAPQFGQSLDVFGTDYGTWGMGFGIDHATFFMPQKNEEQLGLSFNWSMTNVQWLRFIKIVKLSELHGVISANESVEDLYNGRFGYKRMTIGASIGWKM